MSPTKRFWAAIFILLILVGFGALVLTHLKKREPGSGMFGAVDAPPAVTRLG
jgi:hypothetical protein